MPQTITLQLYSLDELDDRAREQARAWYRDGAFDYDWWDAIYDDFEAICERLGVELARCRYGNRNDPDIAFSGFGHQGQGACYRGAYRYRKWAAKAVREYAPQDTELHRIADCLQAAQRKRFYRLRATITPVGHYFSMAIDVQEADEIYAEVPANIEDDIKDALTDLAHWLFKRLETEFEYLNADEQVDEAIRANDYSFTENGEFYA